MVEFWRHLDAMLIDELGLFSAEMVAVLDIVLRYIKNSTFIDSKVQTTGQVSFVTCESYSNATFDLRRYSWLW